jgi:hypothetical protein
LVLLLGRNCVDAGDDDGLRYGSGEKGVDAGVRVRRMNVERDISVGK